MAFSFGNLFKSIGKSESGSVLGIDIGALDVSVMAGYPGTIAATWQRAGRAGRRASRSAAVMVASSAPLDQFMIKNPSYFFDASPERALIDPDNLHILVDHIKCAAFELPFEGSEPFGKHDLQEILGGKTPAANIEIKPHDVISVSESNTRMVYVVGDVQRAGAFNLGSQRYISVLSALSLAGGLGHTAKPEQAKIFRPSPDPQKHEEIAVNIKQILAGKAEDIGLRPQDVLVVPTSSRKTFTVVMTGALAGAISAAIYAGAVVH